MEVRPRRQEPQWRNFAGRWSDVFARQTNKSPRPAERSDRHEKSETGQNDLLEVDRTSTSDAVEGQSSNLELYPRSDWQPVQSVTKHRGNLPIPTTIRAAAFSTICSLRLTAVDNAVRTALQ